MGRPPAACHQRALATLVGDRDPAPWLGQLGPRLGRRPPRTRSPCARAVARYSSASRRAPTVSGSTWRGQLLGRHGQDPRRQCARVGDSRPVALAPDPVQPPRHTPPARSRAELTIWPGSSVSSDARPALLGGRERVTDLAAPQREADRGAQHRATTTGRRARSPVGAASGRPGALPRRRRATRPAPARDRGSG